MNEISVDSNIWCNSGIYAVQFTDLFTPHMVYILAYQVSTTVANLQ